MKNNYIWEKEKILSLQCGSLKLDVDKTIKMQILNKDSSFLIMILTFQLRRLNDFVIQILIATFYKLRKNRAVHWFRFKLTTNYPKSRV